MTCTLLKLFRPHIGNKSWGCQIVSLGSLQTTAKLYLSQHQCLKKGADYSNADLIINRLVPDKVDVDKLYNVDICNNHKRSLTVLHKSTRQKKCSYSDCTKTGQLTKSRVTFELSNNIFEVTGQHVPVGSVLCYDHQSNLTASKSINIK